MFFQHSLRNSIEKETNSDSGVFEMLEEEVRLEIKKKRRKKNGWQTGQRERKTIISNKWKRSAERIKNFCKNLKIICGQ
jgi:hypothetical protein